MKWIKTVDRFPPENVWVLGYYDGEEDGAFEGMFVIMFKGFDNDEDPVYEFFNYGDENEDHYLHPTMWFVFPYPSKNQKRISKKITTNRFELMDL